MATGTDKSNIEVFLGNPIEYDSERMFLNQLRQDLGSMGTEATILANFNAQGNNGHRQIDFLVLTPERLAMVELKSLRQDSLIEGGVNGPWRQIYKDGSAKEIAPNPYEQAKNATHAISDVVKRLTEGGEIPAHRRPFYGFVDTVVCIYPEIPAGSRIDDASHASVVGYMALLNRLTVRGPRPKWQSEHWNALIRKLGLYPDGRDEPGDRRHRESEAALTDYRRRFAARLRSKSTGFVPLGFKDATTEVAFADLVNRVAEGIDIGVIGESGHGKTWAATNVAYELTTRGALVVLADLGEYKPGQFTTLLARATAPFSTIACPELVAYTNLLGGQVVIILDGFNQCPPEAHDTLLNELSAFRLQFLSNLLVTSSIELPVGLADLTLRTTLPDAEAKISILENHGSIKIQRAAEAFTTPFELALAAACETELRPNHTEVDLYDIYIRKLAPNEVMRGGLRLLALALVDELCTSMPLTRAVNILEGAAGLRMTPDHVDSLLGSKLIVINQGYLRFSHELLGRFLAAEAVVLGAASETALVNALAMPQRTELSRFAVALEHDPERRSAVLASCADADLYIAAVRGKMGTSAAAYALAAIRGTLADATFLVSSDHLTLNLPDHDQSVFARWTGLESWSPNEHAMLTAAGQLLTEGYLVEEVCALLDRTDARMQVEIDELSEAGLGAAITTVVSSVVLLLSSGEDVRLGASIVIQSAEEHCWSEQRDPRVVRQIFDRGKVRSWCRLYLATALCTTTEAVAEPTLLPDLLKTAWNADGYHLRLRALETVTRCGRSLSEEVCNAVTNVINEFETSNVGLQSCIIEALAAVNHLEADLPSVEELTETIRTIALIIEDGPEAWDAAAGVCSMQWEADDIVGPYYEAVQALTKKEQISLFLRAARCTTHSLSQVWALERLVEVAPIDDRVLDEKLREMFTEAASGIPDHAGFLDVNFGYHLHGVLGLARFGLPLPPCLSDDAVTLAWHLVDELFVNMETEFADYSATWQRIFNEGRWAVIDVLLEWTSVVPVLGLRGEHVAPMLRQLFDRTPDQFRLLFEWGLSNLSTAPRQQQPLLGPTRERFIIRALSELGGLKTAELLRPFLAEPALADEVVKAIRKLNG